MILASQTDHCLSDLIWRWRQREMPMDLASVESNHPAETFFHPDLQGVTFRLLQDRVLLTGRNTVVFTDCGVPQNLTSTRA